MDWEMMASFSLHTALEVSEVPVNESRPLPAQGLAPHEDGVTVKDNRAKPYNLSSVPFSRWTRQ
jgi:hypothetical protein